MKAVLFALVSVLVFCSTRGAPTKEEIEKFKAMHEKCSKQEGLDMKAVIKDIDDEADNKEFKCFMKCMMIEMGSMNEAGDVQLDQVKGQESGLKPEVWEKAVDECADVTDDDLCEKAYKLTKCVTDSIKKQLS